MFFWETNGFLGVVNIACFTLREAPEAGRPLLNRTRKNDCNKNENPPKFSTKGDCHVYSWL
jgi:hypothetical protein